MKRLVKSGLAIGLALALAGTAWAHGPRSRVEFGVYWGGPWIYPPYYPYPVYAPPVVVPPPTPPVYIERQAAPAMEPGYWYYCAESRAYYPYVQTCPGGWQPVAPQPPQQ